MKTMSEDERLYITNRQTLTEMSLQKFLNRVKIPGLDVKRFTLSTSKPLNLAIAISGGGYRASLTALGFLTALDDRSSRSMDEGHLGGLLQSASYISSISGGTWTLMSLSLSDFLPLARLRNEWDINEPLLEGVPSLKMMDVSRNEIQVLPPEIRAVDDSEFYDKLNNNRNKRDFGTTGDESFDEFYAYMELLPDLDESSHLVERDELKKDDTDWLETFKTFFRDMFKKKEDAKTVQNLLPDVEFAPVLSFRSMKKILNFYKNLHVEVRAKKAAGFPVSFTDYWGRALSRRVFPKSARAPNTTLSGVIDLPSFKRYQQPYPVIISNLREPGIETTSVNSSIFEFTPYEFGSWDSQMFVKMKYLGSSMYDGRPLIHINNRSVCYVGFDNAGFITGTSSSLFNNVLIYIWNLAASSTRDNFRAIKAVLNTFGLTSTQDTVDPKKHPDYALYSPNPFFRYGDAKLSPIYNSKHLFMVDGGEDGQNIPYQPFLQPDRQVDVILSVDSTSDTEGWPNGTIVENTYLRYNDSGHTAATITVNGMIKNINLFPEIPTPSEFVAQGLNKRPVFFGCHLEKYRQRYDSLPKSKYVNSFLPPIVGLFSNSEYSYSSNTSTFRVSYDDAEMSKMIQNAYNIATYANSTIDRDYPRCIGCILIKREFDRKERSLSLLNNMTLPEFCYNCYSKYCYN